ncbi:MAG: aminodeoxychorismate synthase component I [Paracoccaceae bacterium]
MSRKRILFDEGPIAGGTLFAEPSRLIRADSPEEVPDALEELVAAQAAGRWLAGYASYELGYLFSSRLRGLMPASRDVPLLLFGVFDGPDPAPAPTTAGTARLSTPEPVWTPGDYAAAFDRVQAYIAAGDIYQANLTFPMTARAEGAPDDLYAALRAVQPVAHGALVDLGGPVLLSRSPELFFRADATGVLETRPMKGTVPRGASPAEDVANRAWLAASEKNRAENLMIVDLLRNDISRVTEVGSVEVPELFSIETYATVHQMTSLVRGRLRADVRLPDIFRALFPCGSVTGAPKIRAMQIIRELEPAARGAYCGAIGWVAPDGRMSFNVAIRTLTLFEDGAVRLNVGGGVVHDSTAAAEYEEALWKARFATLAPTI